MESKCRSCHFLGLTSLLFLSHPLLAEGTLDGGFYVLSGESDNAFKTDTDVVTERQDEYGANINGTYINSLVDANASYLAKEMRFAEESQEDKSTLEGKSSLLIGKAYHPIDLRLTHSRTTLLKEPDQIALTNNQDAREIFSVIPSLRGRLTSADSLRLSADLTDIKFLENEQSDSSRQGASLVWLHHNSAIQQLQLAVQATDIEFDHFEEINYTYRKAMLGYAINLRKLSYKIELGYNQSDPKIGETYTSPAYSVVLGYKTGLQEIELTTSQIITDSSFGNGNLDSMNDLPTSDGSSGDIDRLERRDTQARWTTSSLCTKCTLSIALFIQNNDYLQEEKQSRQWGGNLNLAYDFTDASMLVLRYSNSEQEFDGEELGRDYDLSVLSAEYSYRFISGLSISLRVEDEKRSAETSMDTYRERYLGAGLHYRF